MALIVTYAKEEKIEVLPPDINKSDTFFTVKNNQIRFGIAALKNVGVNVVEQIIRPTGLLDPEVVVKPF